MCTEKIIKGGEAYRRCLRRPDKKGRRRRRGRIGSIIGHVRGIFPGKSGERFPRKRKARFQSRHLLVHRCTCLFSKVARVIIRVCYYILAKGWANRILCISGGRREGGGGWMLKLINERRKLIERFDAR